MFLVDRCKSAFPALAARQPEGRPELRIQNNPESAQSAADFLSLSLRKF
jgi:hypothetical protein